MTWWDFSLCAVLAVWREGGRARKNMGELNKCISAFLPSFLCEGNTFEKQNLSSEFNTLMESSWAKVFLQVSPVSPRNGLPWLHCVAESLTGSGPRKVWPSINGWWVSKCRKCALLSNIVITGDLIGDFSWRPDIVLTVKTERSRQIWSKFKN